MCPSPSTHVPIIITYGITLAFKVHIYLHQQQVACVIKCVYSIVSNVLQSTILIIISVIVIIEE